MHFLSLFCSHSLLWWHRTFHSCNRQSIRWLLVLPLLCAIRLWLWAGHCLITLMFHSSISRNKRYIFEATKFILPSLRLIGSVYSSFGIYFLLRLLLAILVQTRNCEISNFHIMTSSWRWQWCQFQKNTLVLANPSALTTCAGAQVSHVNCILFATNSSMFVERERCCCSHFSIVQKAFSSISILPLFHCTCSEVNKFCQVFQVSTMTFNKTKENISLEQKCWFITCWFVFHMFVFDVFFTCHTPTSNLLCRQRQCLVNYS